MATKPVIMMATRIRIEMHLARFDKDFGIIVCLSKTGRNKKTSFPQNNHG
jgi:hypothetical protein